MKDEEKKELGKEDQEKTFVVRDRRFSATKEEKEGSQVAGEAESDQPSGDASAKVEALPEIDFNSFIFSLSTSVLIQLGEIEDPFTQKPAKNLPLAKQTIDLIGLLKEKTKGNLTSQEERLIENILYDLRMRFVKASG